MNLPHIELREYNYDLPEDRIAQYPANERDLSKLLVYREGQITHDTFRNLHSHIPGGSLLVFNNTRVIRARLFFRKETGALIEILCLEPLSPPGYEESFSSHGPIEWKCIVGNLKKWKSGSIKASYGLNVKKLVLSAEMVAPEGDAWRIRFSWDQSDMSFGEVIDAAGKLPLPPYIGREAGAEDLQRYQTVYSREKGSVAAPTAGLHFTEHIFERLKESGINTAELTLHVGAGTFKPIKSERIGDHEMHSEHFCVSRETIKNLVRNRGRIIAVGTTSVRTLESLYWLGAKLALGHQEDRAFVVRQWEPYVSGPEIPAETALEALLSCMTRLKTDRLEATTTIMIVPSYRFRIISGMITNFHQPMSSLLLLVSAWTGEKWKEIYKYAIDNDFRFLSYGDGSLLL